MLRDAIIGKQDQLPMNIKSANRNTFLFDNMAGKGTILSSAVAGTEVDYDVSFILSDLSNASGIVAMFDQYRILQVTITFEPAFTQINTNSGAVALGTLYTAIDYDNAAGTTAAGLTQYESCMITPAYKPQSRTFRPHVALAAYGGAFTSYANLGPTWLDCASPGVQHFGAKAALTNCGVTSTIIYNVSARYVVEVRNTI